MLGFAQALLEQGIGVTVSIGGVSMVALFAIYCMCRRAISENARRARYDEYERIPMGNYRTVPLTTGGHARVLRP